MNIKYRAFFCCLILFAAQSVFASQSTTVNILSWWGYLDKPWVSEFLKDKCHTAISFDEYYTNEEFNRRFREYDIDYDIIIFSDTIYNLVKDEIRNKGNSLDKVTNNYNEFIRKNYIRDKYPKNVVYFLHSVTGLLWNPTNFKLNSKKDFYSIPSKDKSKYFIIIDDPIETRLISDNFTKKDFIKLLKLENTYITNDLEPFYDREDFAAAYLWSGDLLKVAMKSKKKLIFTTDQSYSFISSDLIASLNNNPSTSCVAGALASKPFLDKLQNDTSYISPYADTKVIKDLATRRIYENIFKNISDFKWISPLSKRDFHNLNRKWDSIKSHSTSYQ
jgi:hypothetical protein